MGKIDFGDIVKKNVLKFKDNKELEKYYEKKWEKEGYKRGVKVNGINISNIFQKEREKSAFKFLNPKKSDVILDAGCGKGKLAIKISKKCKKIYGVDITKNAFSKASKKSSKNIIFKKMNIEELKFRNNTFDKIVCVEALEHVINPKRVIKEFSRVLKKKGKLVLTYPTLNTNYSARASNFIGIRKDLKISEHLNEFSYNELILEFKKRGFKFVKSEGVVLNLSKFERLMRISKNTTKKMIKFMVSIKKLPRFSSNVTLEFEKN